MGKFIVVGIFSIFLCGLAYRYFPGVGQQLFQVGTVGVTGTMLCFCGFMFGGYKLLGKK